jgi:hypothetical protein
VVGRPARVTITPAVGDTHIAGYLIAVGAPAARTPASWVPAASDGTAVATIVPVASDTTNVLSVQAKKVTGMSGGTVNYRFRANPAPAGPRVTTDATGDHVPDLTTLMDAGNGTSAVWRWDGIGGAVSPPTAPQDVATTYPTAATLAASGDFDGDGLADLAVFRAQGTAGVTLSIQRSDGNALIGTTVWTSDSTWSLATMKAVAGNFDGDAANRADLAVLVDTGAGNWRLWTFAATGQAASPTFAAPALWGAVTSGASNWSAIKLVPADINGDGRTDLAEYYNRTANSQSQLYVHLSTGNAFADGTLAWDSGVGSFQWERSTWVSGDVNGDGLDDLISVYRYDNCSTGVWLALSTGTGLGANTRVWLSATGVMCADQMTPMVADFTGDGHADLAMVYRCCATFEAEVDLLRANGAGFDAPAAVWRGRIGPLQ